MVTLSVLSCSTSVHHLFHSSETDTNGFMTTLQVNWTFVFLCLIPTGLLYVPGWDLRVLWQISNWWAGDENEMHQNYHCLYLFLRRSLLGMSYKRLYWSSRCSSVRPDRYGAVTPAMGTLGQWRRKMKIANRLTIAHIIQKRMMPRQRRFNLFTM